MLPLSLHTGALCRPLIKTHRAPHKIRRTRTCHSRKLTAVCRIYSDALAPRSHPCLVGPLVYNSRGTRVLPVRGTSEAEICFRFCQHGPRHSVRDFVRVLNQRQGSMATAFVVASISCCAIDLRRAALAVSCCATRCFWNATAVCGGTTDTSRFPRCRSYEEG